MAKMPKGLDIQLYNAAGQHIQDIWVAGGAPGTAAAHELANYARRTGEQGTAKVYKSGAFQGRYKLAPDGWKAKKI